MSILKSEEAKTLRFHYAPGRQNEALQIIKRRITQQVEESPSANIPDIIDVSLQIELLKEMNVKVRRIDRHTRSFQADDGC